jgi:hypothetical protein
MARAVFVCDLFDIEKSLEIPAIRRGDEAIIVDVKLDPKFDGGVCAISDKGEKFALTFLSIIEEWG